MINAAIVGLGWWGKTLVSSVQGRSDVIRFTDGHNRTRAKAEAYCAEHGIRLHDDLSTILADPSIDAVVFAARHTDRAEQVERTAAAGKHVFVEKPLALTVAEADRALDATTRAGVVLAVGYQRRLHPSFVELRTRIRDGRLGEVSLVTSDMSAPLGLTLPDASWRLDPAEVPAGGMTALGVHAVDSMIELFGRIDTVYCLSRRKVATRIDDATSIAFGFASGMTGTLSMSTSTAVHFRFAAYGSKAVAEVSTPSMDLFRVFPVQGLPAHGQPTGTLPEVIETKGADPVRDELEVFARSIATNTPHPLTAHDLRHGVEVFEAIVKSIATGQPVRV